MAVFWDNASCHKSATTQTYLVNNGWTQICNVPYHPQFNGIEFVWAQAKFRYRKQLTMKKLDGIKIEREKAIDEVMNSMSKSFITKCFIKGITNISEACGD